MCVCVVVVVVVVLFFFVKALNLRDCTATVKIKFKNITSFKYREVIRVFHLIIYSHFGFSHFGISPLV